MDIKLNFKNGMAFIAKYEGKFDDAKIVELLKKGLKDNANVAFMIGGEEIKMKYSDIESIEY